MGKILVVDDQLGIRHLLGEILRDDHEVEMAANGEEALRLLISYEPDLILLDMKMPGMNGIETLKKMRTLDSEVAVIMMTAYGEDAQSIEQAKGLGILHTMGKPFDLFELKLQVKEIFNSVHSVRVCSKLT